MGISLGRLPHVRIKLADDKRSVCTTASDVPGSFREADWAIETAQLQTWKFYLWATGMRKPIKSLVWVCPLICNQLRQADFPDWGIDPNQVSRTASASKRLTSKKAALPFLGPAEINLEGKLRNTSHMASWRPSPGLSTWLSTLAQHPIHQIRVHCGGRDSHTGSHTGSVLLGLPYLMSRSGGC